MRTTFLTDHPMFARWTPAEVERLLYAVGVGYEHPITGRAFLIPRATSPTATSQAKALMHWTPLGERVPLALAMLWARACARHDYRTRPWGVLELLDLAGEGDRLEALREIGTINVARGVEWADA